MSINLANVFYTYMTGTPFERQALNDVSLTIEKGEVLAIIGHTGSGKSTLVQHLNGLIKPLRGNVTIDGIDIAGRGSDAKQARQQVGMVFQYPEHQIFAETVYEDIAFGPRNRGFSVEEVDKQVHVFDIIRAKNWKIHSVCNESRDKGSKKITFKTIKPAANGYHYEINVFVGKDGKDVHIAGFNCPPSTMKHGFGCIERSWRSNK